MASSALQGHLRGQVARAAPKQLSWVQVAADSTTRMITFVIVAPSRRFRQREQRGEEKPSRVPACTRRPARGRDTATWTPSCRQSSEKVAQRHSHSRLAATFGLKKRT